MKLTIEVAPDSIFVRDVIKVLCTTANPSAVIKAVALGVDDFLVHEEDNRRDESAAIAREFVADLEALQKKWRAKEDEWEVETLAEIAR